MSEFTVEVQGEKFSVPAVPTLGIMRRISLRRAELGDTDTDQTIAFLVAVLDKPIDWVEQITLPDAARIVQQITDKWKQTGFFPTAGQGAGETQQSNTGTS